MTTSWQSKCLQRLCLLGLRAGTGLLAVTLFGSVVCRGGEEFHVRSWHVENGLPDDTITAIAQTEDGYLWVGTRRGLVSFDGTRFRGIGAGPITGLQETNIAALLVDRAGALWVAGVGGSLARREGGVFRVVCPPEKPSERGGASSGKRDLSEAGQVTRWLWGKVYELAEDVEGSMWMVLPSGRLLRWRNGEAHVLGVPNGLPPGDLAGFCGDAQGNLWLVAGNVLYRRRGGEWFPANEGSLGGPLPRLAPARSQGVWVATPNGTWVTGGGSVRRFTGEQWLGGFDRTPWMANSLRSQVTSVLEDRMGRLWLGTLWGGVYCSDSEGRWSRAPGTDSFSQCLITCLFEDKQGAIWVGTLGEGLHQTIRLPVTVLTLPEPGNDNIVTASAAAQDGSVWVGTDGAGAFRWRDGTFTRFAGEEGLTNLHICSILQDRRTQLWVGTWGGLFQLTGSRFSRVQGPKEIGLAVLALLQDRAGGLWIGTPRGVVCMRGESFELFPLRQDNGEVDVRAIAEDAACAIWVGTIGHGLFRREPRAGMFVPVPNFPSPNARSLYCDDSGELWIGSDGAGLVRHQNGEFTGYTTEDGLPSDTISSMITDDQGILWMGSDNGIFACPRQRFRDFRRDRGKDLLLLKVSVQEGLKSRGCSGSGQPVCAKSADGRLWFPNMRGLAVFDPGALTQARNPPLLLVESVVADGKELAAGQEGELAAASSTRRFEFHYTAPELGSPQSLRFRHLLEGMDRDWVDAREQRVAYYSQLPPGFYKFRLVVGGIDGRWHENSRPVLVRVIPRWWERAWVRVLGGAGLIGCAVGGFALNERRKVRRRLEKFELQQTLETERRRIARDLHDDLGSQLTEIVLLGELAKRGEQSASALQEQVSGITRKVRHLVSAMEEIVWTVNPRHDSLPSSAAYLCDYAERFLRAARLSCRLDVGAELPPFPLTAQIRHNLLLAVKEALNNAARHASASTVSLSISLDKGWLAIAVADDGCGFNLSTPGSDGNGLFNMRSRMESVGGRTDIRSQPGHGTSVTFRVPLRDADMMKQK